MRAFGILLWNHCRRYSQETSSFIIDSNLIRNVAIIAHVDHGKTTLVDSLLHQSGCLGVLDEANVRVMDSNVLEKERGITILSKCTSIQRNEYRINIVDTPGHADFGGEVERVLSMVDGVALVVDATEGPMAQTKFVLGKALNQGLKPIVVLNKIDRPSARPDDVDSELLDLFISLGASDSQMDYPIIYASAKEGWATLENPIFLLRERAQLNERQPDHPRISEITAQLHKNKMDVLFDGILQKVPPPKVDRNAPFSLLVNNLENNVYLGKCSFGKIQSGVVRCGDRIRVIQSDNAITEEAKITKLFVKRGLEQIAINEAAAGDIISLAGVMSPKVNATICAPEISTSLPFIPVDPPTLSILFSVNDSPLAGREGKALTTQLLKDRLYKEAETNISITVKDSRHAESACEVFGRGELQLGIIIETIRREGSEINISPPKVVLKSDPENPNKWLEPIEEVIIDVPQDYQNTVIDKLTRRKGELVRVTDHHGKSRIVFHIPTRGLIGYPGEFKNDTRGDGLLTHSLLRYESYRGKLDVSRKGSMISMVDGVATAYALNDLQARGTLFISPGTKVYVGMIVGEGNRLDDMEVNPTKTKALSNMRTVLKDENIHLAPPKLLSLEEAISYLAEDEILEITPKNLRLRKAVLNFALRQRAKREANAIS